MLDYLKNIASIKKKFKERRYIKKESKLKI